MLTGKKKNRNCDKNRSETEKIKSKLITIVPFYFSGGVLNSLTIQKAIVTSNIGLKIVGHRFNMIEYD